MNPETKKKVLRKISYGIYILAVENDGQYSAATITWVSQASFEPPLLMIGLKKSSNTYKFAIDSKKFSINFLDDSQKNMAASFFKDTKFEGGKLNGYDIEIGKTGVPVFKNINSYFECELIKIIEGGDHNVILAEIKNAENLTDQDVLNLVDTGWKYGG
jgi:flavin reductase (DIM6/NTAB) family NADH-FMN oxidoreductase RutF